jgi:hypothetical protein
MSELQRLKKKDIESIPDFKEPYRITSYKEYMKEAKFFTKYYMKDFNPISDLEKKDYDGSKTMYRGLVTIPPIMLMTMSFLNRKFRFQTTMMHELKAKSPLDNMVNDVSLGFLGYVIGNVYSFTWNYKNREYVRHRLKNEKEMGFSRNEFLKYHRQELLGDYKYLAQYSEFLKSDDDIRDLRRLQTEDPRKLAKLRELHDEFASENSKDRPSDPEPNQSEIHKPVDNQIIGKQSKSETNF